MDTNCVKSHTGTPWTLEITLMLYPFLQMSSLRLDKNKQVSGENSRSQKPGLTSANGNGILAAQCWTRHCSVGTSTPWSH